jgi:hypothetical protein
MSARPWYKRPDNWQRDWRWWVGPIVLFAMLFALVNVVVDKAFGSTCDDVRPETSRTACYQVHRFHAGRLGHHRDPRWSAREATLMHRGFRHWRHRHPAQAAAMYARASKELSCQSMWGCFIAQFKHDVSCIAPMNHPSVCDLRYSTTPPAAVVHTYYKNAAKVLILCGGQVAFAVATDGTTLLAQLPGGSFCAWQAFVSFW